MKRKKIAMMVVSFLILTACSNNNENDVVEKGESKMVKVTFNVQSLNVDVEPMQSRTRSASANDVLSYIDYAIYKTGALLKTGSQSITANASTFGTIEETLPTGEYYLVFTGRTGENANIGNFQCTWDESIGHARVSSYNKDLFYLKKTHTITQESNVNIEMPRLVGKLVFRLTDTEKPSDVAKVMVNFYDGASWSVLDNCVLTNRSTTRSEEIRFTNGAFEEIGFYLLPHDNGGGTIKTYDSNDNEIASVPFNFDIKSHQKTIVSGNLFDVINGRDFTITVLDEWVDDININLQ